MAKPKIELRTKVLHLCKESDLELSLLTQSKQRTEEKDSRARLKIQ